MPARRDPKQVALNKVRLTEAFIELLDTHDYRDINVSMLCNAAGLARNEFYKIFGTMDNIFRCWVNDQMEQYRAYSDLPDGEAHHISHRNIKKAFMMFKDHEFLVMTCVEAGMGQYVLDAFVEYMQSNFKNSLAEGPGAGRRAYVLEAYASAVYTTSIRWLRNGAREAPEEMADILYAVYGEHI